MILLVDDVEINRDILGEPFQLEYQILEAENGEQVMLLLEEYHTRIAVLLLDVVMLIKTAIRFWRRCMSRVFMRRFRLWSSPLIIPWRGSSKPLISGHRTSL